MDPRISFVSLVVGDLAASRRFYVEGLGWPVAMEAADEVVMIKAQPGIVLALWARDAARGELGEIAAIDGVPPFTFAHNVATPAEVDAVLATARAAGAVFVEDGLERAWGGYTGYFADPDGFRWEIAHNPSPIGEWVLDPVARQSP